MAKLNPFTFQTEVYDWETDKIYWKNRYYDWGPGRFSNRDPIEEDGGLNLYGFVGNDPIDFWDYLGLEWQILRNRNSTRASAWATSASDTFDELAQQLHLDTSDYKVWLQTSDTQPNLCKVYSIPNIIYIDFGKRIFADPLNGFSAVFRHQQRNWGAKMEAKGYDVMYSDPVSDSAIKAHLRSPDLVWYSFVGHGSGTIINTPANGVGMPSPGVIPDRYTKYGIRGIFLAACGSAMPDIFAGRFWQYNRWQANVATRGVFLGFDSDYISLWNWPEHLVIAPGSNNNP